MFLIKTRCRNIYIYIFREDFQVVLNHFSSESDLVFQLLLQNVASIKEEFFGVTEERTSNCSVNLNDLVILEYVQELLNKMVNFYSKFLIPKAYK